MDYVIEQYFAQRHLTLSETSHTNPFNSLLLSLLQRLSNKQWIYIDFDNESKFLEYFHEWDLVTEGFPARSLQFLAEIKTLQKQSISEEHKQTELYKILKTYFDVDFKVIIHEVVGKFPSETWDDEVKGEEIHLFKSNNTFRLIDSTRKFFPNPFDYTNELIDQLVRFNILTKLFQQLTSSFDFENDPTYIDIFSKLNKIQNELGQCSNFQEIFNVMDPTNQENLWMLPKLMQVENDELSNEERVNGRVNLITIIIDELYFPVRTKFLLSKEEYEMKAIEEGEKKVRFLKTREKLGTDIQSSEREIEALQNQLKLETKKEADLKENAEKSDGLSQEKLLRLNQLKDSLENLQEEKAFQDFIHNLTTDSQLCEQNTLEGLFNLKLPTNLDDWKFQKLIDEITKIFTLQLTSQVQSRINKNIPQDKSLLFDTIQQLQESCSIQEESTGTLVVRGKHSILSTILPRILDSKRKTSIEEIHFILKGNLVLDINMEKSDFSGINIAIVADNIIVTKPNLIIDLSGQDAIEHAESSAESGRGSGRPGMDGEHGKAGKNGGSFHMEALSSFVNEVNLQVKGSGGKGGNGQNGGHGMNGDSGANGEDATPLPEPSWFSSYFSSFNLIARGTEGKQGDAGGVGGIGGLKGLGGNGGFCTIKTPIVSQCKDTKFDNGKDGDEGRNGYNGENGKHGVHGRDHGWGKAGLGCSSVGVEGYNLWAKEIRNWTFTGYEILEGDPPKYPQIKQNLASMQREHSKTQEQVEKQKKINKNAVAQAAKLVKSQLQKGGAEISSDLQSRLDMAKENLSTEETVLNSTIASQTLAWSEYNQQTQLVRQIERNKTMKSQNMERMESQYKALESQIYDANMAENEAKIMAQQMAEVAENLKSAQEEGKAKSIYLQKQTLVQHQVQQSRLMTLNETEESGSGGQGKILAPGERMRQTEDESKIKPDDYEFFEKVAKNLDSDEKENLEECLAKVTDIFSKIPTNARWGIEYLCNLESPALVGRYTRTEYFKVHLSQDIIICENFNKPSTATILQNKFHVGNSMQLVVKLRTGQLDVESIKKVKSGIVDKIVQHVIDDETMFIVYDKWLNKFKNEEEKAEKESKDEKGEGSIFSKGKKKFDNFKKAMDQKFSNTNQDVDPKSIFRLLTLGRKFHKEASELKLEKFNITLEVWLNGLRKHKGKPQDSNFLMDYITTKHDWFKAEFLTQQLETKPFTQESNRICRFLLEKLIFSIEDLEKIHKVVSKMIRLDQTNDEETQNRKMLVNAVENLYQNQFRSVKLTKIRQLFLNKTKTKELNELLVKYTNMNESKYRPLSIQEKLKHYEELEGQANKNSELHVLEEFMFTKFIGEEAPSDFIDGNFKDFSIQKFSNKMVDNIDNEEILQKDFMFYLENGKPERKKLIKWSTGELAKIESICWDNLNNENKNLLTEIQRLVQKNVELNLEVEIQKFNVEKAREISDDLEIFLYKFITNPDTDSQVSKVTEVTKMKKYLRFCLLRIQLVLTENWNSCMDMEEISKKIRGMDKSDPTMVLDLLERFYEAQLKKAKVSSSTLEKVEQFVANVDIETAPNPFHEFLKALSYIKLHSVPFSSDSKNMHNKIGEMKEKLTGQEMNVLKNIIGNVNGKIEESYKDIMVIVNLQKFQNIPNIKILQKIVKALKNEHTKTITIDETILAELQNKLYYVRLENPAKITPEIVSKVISDIPQGLQSMSLDKESSYFMPMCICVIDQEFTSVIQMDNFRKYIDGLKQMKKYGTPFVETIESIFDENQDYPVQHISSYLADRSTQYFEIKELAKKCSNYINILKKSDTATNAAPTYTVAEFTNQVETQLLAKLSFCNITETREKLIETFSSCLEKRRVPGNSQAQYESSLNALRLQRGILKFYLELEIILPIFWNIKGEQDKFRQLVYENQEFYSRDANLDELWEQLGELVKENYKIHELSKTTSFQVAQKFLETPYNSRERKFLYRLLQKLSSGAIILQQTNQLPTKQQDWYKLVVPEFSPETLLKNLLTVLETEYIKILLMFNGNGIRTQAQIEGILCTKSPNQFVPALEKLVMEKLFELLASIPRDFEQKVGLRQVSQKIYRALKKPKLNFTWDDVILTAKLLDAFKTSYFLTEPENRLQWLILIQQSLKKIQDSEAFFTKRDLITFFKHSNDIEFELFQKLLKTKFPENWIKSILYHCISKDFSELVKKKFGQSHGQHEKSNETETILAKCNYEITRYTENLHPSKLAFLLILHPHLIRERQKSDSHSIINPLDISNIFKAITDGNFEPEIQKRMNIEFQTSPIPYWPRIIRKEFFKCLDLPVGIGEMLFGMDEKFSEDLVNDFAKKLSKIKFSENILKTIILNFKSSEWIFDTEALTQLQKCTVTEDNYQQILTEYSEKKRLKDLSLEDLISSAKSHRLNHENQNLLDEVGNTIEQIKKVLDEEYPIEFPTNKTKFRQAIENWIKEVGQKNLRNWKRSTELSETEIISLVALIYRAVQYHFFSAEKIEDDVLFTPKISPRDAQLLSLLLLITGTQDERWSKMGQIETGEGKSCIVAMFAAYCGLLGGKVHVITSNKVLAEEGEEEYKGFFSLFQLKSTNNCDKTSREDSERRKRYNGNIVYGDLAEFQGDYLNTTFHGKNTLEEANYADVLIVDEVDSLLLDKGAHMLYLSHDIPELKYIRPIFLIIWQAVQTCECQPVRGKPYSEANVNSVRRSIEKRLKDPTAQRLLYPESMDSFIDERLGVWVKQAFRARFMPQNVDFILQKDAGKVVNMDNSTGVEQSNMQLSLGLHQFLQLRFQTKLSPETLKCVFISNLKYFQNYKGKIYGITGTLGDDEELKLLRDKYDVNFFGMPRFKHNKMVEKEAALCTNDEDWQLQIQESILQHAEQPVLIIAETIDMLEKIQKSLNSKLVNRKIWEYKSSETDIKFTKEVKDREGLTKNDLVLSTNLAGRGTDFKIHADAKKHGLHVILPYLPSNVRVEKQAFGRTARAGESGTVQFILRVSKEDQNLGIDGIREERKRRDIQRLQIVREREIPKIEIEDALFEQYSKFLGNEIKNSRAILSLPEAIQKLQIGFLNSRWAIWLDSIRELLDALYLQEKTTKEHIDAKFRTFKTEQLQKLQSNTSSEMPTLFAEYSSDFTKLGLCYELVATRKLYDAITKLDMEEAGKIVTQSYKDVKDAVGKSLNAVGVIVGIKSFKEVEELVSYLKSPSRLELGSRFLKNAFTVDQYVSDPASLYSATILLQLDSTAKKQAKEYLKHAKTKLLNRIEQNTSCAKLLDTSTELAIRRGEVQQSTKNHFQSQISGENNLLQFHIDAINLALRTPLSPRFIKMSVPSIGSDEEALQLFNLILSNTNGLLKFYRLSQKLKFTLEKEKEREVFRDKISGFVSGNLETIVDILESKIKKNDLTVNVDDFKTSAITQEGILELLQNFHITSQKPLENFTISIDPERYRAYRLSSIKFPKSCASLEEPIKILFFKHNGKVYDEKKLFTKPINGTKSPFVELSKKQSKDLKEFLIHKEIQWIKKTKEITHIQSNSVYVKKFLINIQKLYLEVPNIDYDAWKDPKRLADTNLASYSNIPVIQVESSPDGNGTTRPETHFLMYNNHNIIKIGINNEEGEKDNQVQAINEMLIEKYDSSKDTSGLTETILDFEEMKFKVFTDKTGQLIHWVQQNGTPFPKLGVVDKKMCLITHKITLLLSIDSTTNTILSCEKLIEKTGDAAEEYNHKYLLYNSSILQLQVDSKSNQCTDFKQFPDLGFISSENKNLCTRENLFNFLSLKSEISKILINKESGRVNSEFNLEQFPLTPEAGSNQIFHSLLKLEIIKEPCINFPTLYSNDEIQERKAEIKTTIETDLRKEVLEIYEKFQPEINVDELTTKEWIKLPKFARYLVDEVKDKFKGSPEDQRKELQARLQEEKVKRFENYLKQLIKALEISAGTLKSYPKIRVNYSQLKSKVPLESNQYSEELNEFIREGLLDRTFTFDENISWYENKATLVMLLGMAEIAVGVAIEVMSGGMLSPLAQILISEGASDIYYSANQLWHGQRLDGADYWEYKKESMILSTLTLGAGGGSKLIWKGGSNLASKIAIRLVQHFCIEGGKVVLFNLIEDTMNNAINSNQSEITQILNQLMSSPEFEREMESLTSSCSTLREKSFELRQAEDWLNQLFGKLSEADGVASSFELRLEQMFNRIVQRLAMGLTKVLFKTLLPIQNNSLSGQFGTDSKMIQQSSDEIKKYVFEVVATFNKDILSKASRLEKEREQYFHGDEKSSEEEFQKFIEALKTKLKLDLRKRVADYIFIRLCSPTLKRKMHADITSAYSKVCSNLQTEVINVEVYHSAKALENKPDPKNDLMFDESQKKVLVQNGTGRNKAEIEKILKGNQVEYFKDNFGRVYFSVEDDEGSSTGMYMAKNPTAFEDYLEWKKEVRL